MEVWTLWTPLYWLSGAIKAITALASVPTAILLAWSVPKALALPSPRELREANQSLMRTLDEKVALLHEVHHRVKNNLQLIISALRLQAREAGEPARQILHESENRVRAMALVHERLYRTELSRVDLGAYLTDLVAQLLRTTEGARVKAEVSAEGIEIGPDVVIPCGLIVNEAVTNCLKHAFPGGRRGTIHVRVEERGPEWIELSVRDDGAGLPVGFDLAKGTRLGLRIAHILAQQRDGTLCVAPAEEGGTALSARLRVRTSGSTSAV
jgi:two-component sensor histidine kinase